MLATFPTFGWAAQPSLDGSHSVPCAILERFDGTVQILDPTRTHLIDSTIKTGVPCGGWVSTRKGWAELKHIQGFSIKLGPDTFVEIYDNQKDRQMTFSDHIVLYKGKVFLTTGGGSGELRVVTANGRARIPRGQAMVLYNQWDEETQLVSIVGYPTLENRFEASRRIMTRPGEATDLNFKAMRIVPSAPSAMKVTALKILLDEFKLPIKELKRALVAAKQRHDRRYPYRLANPDSKQKAAPRKEPKRMLATSDSQTFTYVRHPPQKGDDEVRKKWVRKLVGGQEAGEKILYPDKYYGRERKADIELEDPALVVHRRQKKEEEKEKQRLIDALLKIRME